MRVNTRSTGRIGRHERSHLRQNYDGRSLPQIGGLSAHVGTRNHRDELRIGVEVKIIGNEAGGFFFSQLFDHWMASGYDADLAGIGKCRPCISIFGSHLCQRAGDIQLRNGSGRLPDSRGVLGGEQSKFLKNLALQCQHFFFRVQNLAFEFLELRRGEPFGVHQRLLALVISGRVM